MTDDTRPAGTWVDRARLSPAVAWSPAALSLLGSHITDLRMVRRGSKEYVLWKWRPRQGDDVTEARTEE